MMKIQRLRHYLIIMLIFFGVLFILLEFNNALVSWHNWVQGISHICSFLGIPFAIASLRLVGEMKQSIQSEE